MKDKDLLVDRVSKKTNVKKEDIFKLANDLQKKDLNNEKICSLESKREKTWFFTFCYNGEELH